MFQSVRKSCTIDQSHDNILVSNIDQNTLDKKEDPMTKTPMPHIKKVLVTPETAAEWLNNNTTNRSLRLRQVAAYARDIKSGRWNGLNGETIKISENEELLDGQHRLHAIIEANESVELFVTFNAPLDSQLTIDTGIRRSFSDILNMRGESDVNMLGAITRGAHMALNGWENSKTRRFRATTNTELLRTYDMYRDSIVEATHYAHTNSRILNVPPSLLGTCYWWIYHVINERYNNDQDFDYQNFADFTFFFDRLKDGQNLSPTDPIYVLRKTLMHSNQAKAGWSQGSRKFIFIAIIIKAWNAFKGGQQISRLTYRPGGVNPEKFPEVM